MVVTSTTAKSLFVDARLTQLGDAEGTTWADAAMIVAYNQAVKMLVQVRPDAVSKIFTLSLVEGSRQYLPNDGLRLIKVVRNIRANGGIGRAIRIVRMSDWDAVSPYWHEEKGPEVYEYAFDPLSPKHFYIYPAPINFGEGIGQKIEIEYSFMPADITLSDMDALLPFDSIFDQPLIELMLYKLLSGDNVQGRNNTQHLQNAMAMIKNQGDISAAISPAEREK